MCCRIACGELDCTVAEWGPVTWKVRVASEMTRENITSPTSTTCHDCSQKPPGVFWFSLIEPRWCPVIIHPTFENDGMAEMDLIQFHEIASPWKRCSLICRGGQTMNLRCGTQLEPDLSRRMSLHYQKYA